MTSGLTLRMMSPVLVVLQRHVGEFITFDPLQEVGHRLLFVTVSVVGAAQLHLLSSESERVQKETFLGSNSNLEEIK